MADATQDPVAVVTPEYKSVEDAVSALSKGTLPVGFLVGKDVYTLGMFSKAEGAPVELLALKVGETA